MKPFIKPKISVIIPAYNSCRYIGRAIESALAQTLPPLEIIVIDDGSMDDTAKIASSFPFLVKVLSKRNGGPASARNLGAKESDGDWLAFLDADDAWLPEKLEKQAHYTQDDNITLIHSTPRTQDKFNLIIPDDLTFERLWKRNCIINSSVLLRKSDFLNIGCLDEDRELIGVEDYNLWLRLAYAGKRMITIRDDIVHYYVSPGNLTSQVEKFAEAEFSNLYKLANELQLSSEIVKQKYIDLLDLYGRYLFSLFIMNSARGYLIKAFKEKPTLRRAGWIILTLIPSCILIQRQNLKKGLYSLLKS